VAQRTRIWESALLRSRETALQIRTSYLFAGWNGPPGIRPCLILAGRAGGWNRGVRDRREGALDGLLAKNDEGDVRRRTGEPCRCFAGQPVLRHRLPDEWRAAMASKGISVRTSNETVTVPTRRRPGAEGR
jgi:hypothetical protein